WELRNTLENAHAWVAGYTPQIATAVWVGNEGKEKALRDKHGNKVGSHNIPAEIWQKFMNTAHTVKNFQKIEYFAERKGIGDPDAGNGTSPPPPSPTPGDRDCRIPLFCPPGDNGNGNGNGNDDDRNPPDRDGGGGGG